MDRITIVGMGLIGTSLGLALKKANLGVEIVGTDRDRAVSGTAKRMGACDSTQNNPLDAIRGARMVILATPVGGIREMLRLYGPELEPGVIVTDTGSTKAEVLAWAEEFLPDTVSFVGGHPMAGKELSGPVAADGDLFQNATYCIIPGSGADEEAVRIVPHMAASVAAKPLFIDAREHDSYVAAISHLPLVLSTVLVKLNADNPAWPEIAKLAANGFRDVSRLASGSPEMSRDICLTNKEALNRWIDEFIRELQEFRGMVDEGDERTLGRAFDGAWEARDRWVQNKITARSAAPMVELPTSAETMGGLIMGDRAAGRVRQMLEWQREDNKRKDQS